MLLLAGPAGADTISDRKQSVDHELANLRDNLEGTRQREAALQGEIAAVTGRIRTLEQEVGDVAKRLAPLEEELRLRELKLNRLNALYRVQSERLAFLRREYRIALARLNERLVAIYESEETDAFAVVLSARSFGDLLDAIDYLRQIGREDKRIADVVGAAKADVKVAHGRTKRARDGVEQEARVVAVRVSQARDLRDRLVASRDRLAGGRTAQQQSLASLTAEKRSELAEIDALSRESSRLAAQIQAAQSRSSSPPAPAGALGWPASGPVTSAYGSRWGRLHEGIDIGAPYGAPIVAAAAGTVIYAGWLGGYGNLVVIDHGGGVATAYAHQSQIAVSVGQVVSRGQTIGYVGSTGYSTGPHVHFEVRVDGRAVDPLGYL